MSSNTSSPAFTEALAKAKEIAAKLSTKTSPGNGSVTITSTNSQSPSLQTHSSASPTSGSFDTASQSMNTATIAPKHMKTTLEFSIPGYKVGLIIGAKGETLKRIERVTDTRITFEPLTTPNPNDMPERRGFIVGLPDDCERAKQLVLEKAEEATLAGAEAGKAASIASSISQGIGGPSFHTPYHRDPQGNLYPTFEMSIPNSKVGLCIGRGGETIRELQDRSGAKIFIAPDSTPGSSDPYSNRPVIVSGPDSAIHLAKQLISEVLETGKATGSTQPTILTATQHDPTKTTVVLTVPDHLVGLLIGKRGEGMKHITSQSRARVSVDPPFSNGSPTRFIYVSGHPESVAIAQQMIHDRLASAAAMEGNIYQPISTVYQPDYSIPGASMMISQPFTAANGSVDQLYYQQQSRQSSATTYTQEQLKQIYDYYHQYYVQAGCDPATASEAAKSAMIGAGIPLYTESSKTHE